MSRTRERERSDEKSWLEVVPQHRMFEDLRSNCSGGSVNMTFVRGNLFVWKRFNDTLCDGDILTMNLTKLAAYPDTDCYQVIQSIYLIHS